MLVNLVNQKHTMFTPACNQSRQSTISHLYMSIYTVTFCPIQTEVGISIASVGVRGVSFPKNKHKSPNESQYQSPKQSI